MANKTPLIPVMHIYPTQDAIIYKTRIKDGIAKIDDNKIAKVGSKNIFTIYDKTGTKKRKFKCIIYLDGKVEACSVQNGLDMKTKMIEQDKLIRQELNLPLEGSLTLAELEDIPSDKRAVFEPLTLRDTAIMVKREIVKQMSRAKAMETWQFGILAVLVVAGIVLNFVL